MTLFNRSLTDLQPWPGHDGRMQEVAKVNRTGHPVPIFQPDAMRLWLIAAQRAVQLGKPRWARMALRRALKHALKRKDFYAVGRCLGALRALRRL